jgi:UDP-2,4-diacetamido-2,4,6-trideoxy-beta-L-altropyranose hydrolase
MMQVFFRVDANREIGTGHFMRCRLLARKLRGRGASATFLTNATHSSLLRELETEGFTVRRLAAQEAADPNAILAKIGDRRSPGSLLVIDSNLSSFYSTNSQQCIRRSGLRLMMITFRHDCHFVADIVHNQNLLALEHDYAVESYTTLLLGPRYVILADAFQHLGQEGRETPRHVETLLTSFGGADGTNQTKRVIVALAAMKAAPPHVIVVVGALYADIDGLGVFLSKETQLSTELHINTPQMPELMAKSDLAITSGGLTIWELACAGIPNVVISTSEHERQTGLLIDQRGLCCYLGHHDQISQEQIAHALAALLGDQERRREMALAGKRLVDGRGIQRVTDHMVAVLRGEPEHG